jgi:hypothetical protein
MTNEKKETGFERMDREMKELKEMGWEHLKAEVGNEIYQATSILERLENASRIWGNGHHWRQQIVGIIMEHMEERRTCKEEPTGCPSCGQERKRMMLNEDKTTYHCVLCDKDFDREA